MQPVCQCALMPGNNCLACGVHFACETAVQCLPVRASSWCDCIGDNMSGFGRVCAERAAKHSQIRWRNPHLFFPAP